MEELASEQNAEIKDIKIQKLEATVSKLRRENAETEKAKVKMRDEIRNWKKKYEYEQTEHEFYQKNAMESKRKNKLLKVAVGRLQFEYDRLQEKYQITDDELKFVKALHNQIEKAYQPNTSEDDAGTFMTRISEDGQGSHKGTANLHRTQQTENDDYNSKAVVLPNLQIKSPPTGSSKHIRGHATDESFLSAVPKSVGSSRNAAKNRFFTQPKHGRAHSNANANRASLYKQGTIPTENLKFSQFLDILFCSGMNKEDIREETQGYV